MDNKYYKITFSGEIIDGKNPISVKNYLRNLLKINSAQAELLFSGKTVTIRKKVNATTAKKCKILFNRAGAVCHIIPYSEAEKSEQPLIECPKCHKKQPPSDTCLHCGIIFRKIKEKGNTPDAHEDEGVVQAGNGVPTELDGEKDGPPEPGATEGERETTRWPGLELTIAMIVAALGCFVATVNVAENLSKTLQIGALSTITILVCAFSIVMFAFLRSFKFFILSAIVCGTIVSVASHGKMDMSALAGFIFGMFLQLFIFAILGGIVGFLFGFFVRGVLEIGTSYAQARKDPLAGPAKINLSALLQPRYLLMLASITGICVLGYFGYGKWKTHKEYLIVDESAMEYVRSEYIKGRMDLHLNHKFSGLESFPELARGTCPSSGVGDFIRRLKDSKDMGYDDIVACAVKFNHPMTIKPFFEWYDIHSDDKAYFSTRSMSDLFILMKSEAVPEIKDVFFHSNNPKVLRMCVHILSYIGSEEAMNLLSDSIIHLSAPSCSASAHAIDVLVTSDFVKKETAFDLIKATYGLEDPALRLKAIRALRFFRGKGPLELLEKAEDDADDEVQRASIKMKQLYSKK
ncbi:MAG: MFS transporter [Desulfobacteraceae bacterium]